jgi:hypothetical protein
MTSASEATAIIAALRGGLVPNRGLERLVTGLEPLAATVGEELDFVAGGKGASKWLRGEYGSGKTFATRYLCAHARARGFATSEVQVSSTDTPLHHLETVYRRLVERLETAADGPNAFQPIVDAWLYQLGDEVTRLRGLGEDDPGFADATEQRLEDRLAALSRRTPAYAQVLRAYHRASHDGDLATAQGLLAWLAGQPHTDRTVLKGAAVRGRVDGQASLSFLSGLLQLLTQTGYAGLVVVLDEVETIQKMNAQTRTRSLEALRTLMDMLAKDELPGLYLLVTGTRDFFEGHKGLRGAPALHQRVHVVFDDDARFDNLRAPQVRLRPFDAPRLLEVGRKVRDLYPARAVERVRSRVDDRFLDGLVQKVTTAFGGRVEVAPRLFLRELVDVLDRVDQHEAYDPAEHYALDLVDESRLSAEELAARHGRDPSRALDADPSDGTEAPVGPGEATEGDATGGEAAPRGPRRLDG